MLANHAYRRAIATGLRHSSSNTSKASYDIRFVRAFIRAALHGHSPAFKRQGWKTSNLKHGKSKPLSYLSADLVEEDFNRTTEKGGIPVKRADGNKPRIFRVDPDQSYARGGRKRRRRAPGLPHSRSYATEAGQQLVNLGSIQESDFAAEERNLDAEPTGSDQKDASRELPSIQARYDSKLKPGDWVQLVA